MSPSSQTLMGLLGILLTTAALIDLTFGLKDYEESCSSTASVTNLVSKSEDPETCDSKKDLICVINVCRCGPQSVYEEGILWGIFGGGKCYGRANFPCLGDEKNCVSNAKCEGSSFPTCKCNEGYHSNDGHCVSGGIRVEVTSIMTLTMMMGSILLMSFSSMGA